MPNPDTCVAFGEPCKNVGIPCCEGLACGSGQGGSEVACWVRKTGRCASTAECIFGTECVEGICIAVLPPPPGPTCNVQLGEVCGSGDVCCVGTCASVADQGVRELEEPRCCVGIDQPCSGDDDECCGSLGCNDGTCGPV